MENQRKFREMRRKDRAMPAEEALELLRLGDYGILSTVGADGEAYGVPLSYALCEGKYIYFHCAREGRKVDNIAHNPNVCLAVVGSAKPAIDGTFTVLFESVIVFGTAEELQAVEEKRGALKLICEKYFPGEAEITRAGLESGINAVAIYKITISRITGKRREL